MSIFRSIDRKKAADLFSLTNEVAVVIGGTGGLGGAMADALASQGAKVVVIGRNEERGAARVAAIEAAGGYAHFQSADAMDAQSLKAACAAINDSVGVPSVQSTPLEAIDPKQLCRREPISASCLWVRGGKSLI